MKNKNSIYSLDGVGKVYKFTLTQAFKNKGYRVSFIIMIVMIMLLGPIMRLGAKSGSKVVTSVSDVKEEEVNMTEILVLNETGVQFKEEELKFKGTAFEKVKISYPTETKDEILGKLTNTQVLLYITNETEEDGMAVYKINLIAADETEVKGDILDDLGSYLKDNFDNTRYEQAGVDKDVMALISNGFDEKKTYSDTEFKSAASRKYSETEVVALGTTFAVILLMVLSMASSYIVSSVMEEKVSKLVETLMISVKPLALVMGKIFAMLTYVGLIIICGFLGSKLSNFIMDQIAGKADDQASKTLNFDALFKVGTINAIIIIAAVLLVFMIFAFISGIAGSACSKAEDMQSANGTITMLIMVGYIAAMLVPQIENTTIIHVMTYIPVLSCFVAPVLYIIESISLVELIAFFVINIVVAVAMFFICAKVYRKLILIDGSKVKIKEIFKMIFTSDKTRKEAA
ncbi:MAG: ABC transporter permease [Eubacterium sp.]|nr:ABC transporter permease [Eubacterium sp.]